MKKKLSFKITSIVISLILIIAITSIFGTNLIFAGEEEKNPVIFVHGLGGAAYNFTSIQSHLQSNGWDSDSMKALDLPSKSGAQTTNANAISETVDEMLQKTGASEVDIVAHSMGGANSLYYIINNGGSDKVEKLVTLGGANRLTTSTVPDEINMTSITGTSDAIVSASLSNITGAETVSLSGVGHIALLSNSQAKSEIVKALQGSDSSNSDSEDDSSDNSSNNWSSFFDYWRNLSK
jgi:triacylglycerol lipase